MEPQEATSSSLTYNLRQWLNKEFLKNCVFQYNQLKSVVRDALEIDFSFKAKCFLITTCKFTPLSNIFKP